METNKRQVSAKLWHTTRDILKIASAMNSESMCAMAHRLITAEYKRIVENFDRKEGIQISTETE